jgi:hypothetical protein
VAKWGRLVSLGPCSTAAASIVIVEVELVTTAASVALVLALVVGVVPPEDVEPHPLTRSAAPTPAASASTPASA